MSPYRQTRSTPAKRYGRAFVTFASQRSCLSAEADGTPNHGNRHRVEAAMKRSRILAALAIFLGVAMIGGGAMKLAGQSAQVEAFGALGLPGWFRILVGTFEVIGGLLVMAPLTSPAGTLILSTILVGALWAHVAHSEWSHAVPVIVLLALFLTIFRANRERAIQLLRGV